MAEAKKPAAKKSTARKPGVNPKKAMTLTDGSPPKPGRPTIFDATRSEALLNAIRLGAPIAVSCDFAGISRATLALWRNRGEKARAADQGKLSPIDRKFVVFIDALDKAVAQAAIQAQRTIHTLMSQEVKNATPEQQRIAMSAAQFFLTHRLSRHYNTSTRTELTGRDGGPLEVALTSEQAWEIVRSIQSGEPIDPSNSEPIDES